MLDSIKELNEWIKQVSDLNEMPFIDTYKALSGKDGSLDPKFDSGDGVHLSPEGYKKLGSVIRKSIKEHLQKGVTITCLGDSITRGHPGWVSGPHDGDELVPYPKFLEKPGVIVENLGMDGATTDTLYYKLQNDVIPRCPEICIIIGGANDLLCGFTTEDVARNLGMIYRDCLAAGILPIGCTVPPVKG